MDLLNSLMICIIANLLFAIHSIGTYENIKFGKLILSELNIMLNLYDIHSYNTKPKIFICSFKSIFQRLLYILVYDYSLSTDNIGIRFVFNVKFFKRIVNVFIRFFTLMIWSNRNHTGHVFKR